MADAMMDWIGGQVPEEFSRANPMFHPSDFFELWNKHREGGLPTSASASRADVDSGAGSGSGAGAGAGAGASAGASAGAGAGAGAAAASSRSDLDSVGPSASSSSLAAQPGADDFRRDSLSLWALFVLCLKRALVSHSRSKLAFFVDNALVFIAALFIGLVYFNETLYAAPKPTGTSLRGRGNPPLTRH